MHFNPFEMIAIAIGYGWPIALIVLAALIVAAVKFKGWPRYVTTSLAAVLGTILLFDGLFFVYVIVSDRLNHRDADAETKRLTVTLTADTPVARSDKDGADSSGMLPAGTTVEWYSDAHDGFYYADLSRPATFIGASWKGRLKHSGQGFWSGTLASDLDVKKDSVVWHCQAGGDAQFDNTIDDPMSCVLARDFQAFDQRFPAGTEVQLINEPEFTVLAGRTLVLSGLGLTVGPDTVVKLDASGHVKEVELNRYGTVKPDPVVLFRGVAISDGFHYAYTANDSAKPLLGIRIQVDPPIACAGRTIPLDANAIVPLTGNAILVENDSGVVDRVAGCLR